MCLSDPFRLCAPKAWQLGSCLLSRRSPVMVQDLTVLERALAGAALLPSSASWSWGSGHQKDPVKPQRKSESSTKPVRDRRWEELSRQTIPPPSPRAVALSPLGDVLPALACSDRAARPARHCAVWCPATPLHGRFALILALTEQTLSPGSSPSAPLYFLVLSEGCGCGME